MPAPNCLIVPLQLNGVYVDSGITVTGALTDFSRLPWSSGKEDFNSDVPFLGNVVMSPPFQDKNFTLASGVHLHWILPEAHRSYPATEASTGTKKRPHAAPNRWLVTRLSDNRQWVVESDYINQNSTLHNRNAVAVPAANMGEPLSQPFVYLGRQLLLQDWLVTNSSAENYWNSLNNTALTAFGYGEFSFNAFYPNCRSVFGFYDPDNVPGAGEINYEVLGWYADGDDDIVKSAVKAVDAVISDPRSDTELLKRVFDDNGNCPKWLNDLITNEAQNKLWPPGITASVNNYKNIRAQLLSNHFDKGILNALLDIDIAYKNEFYNFGIKQILNWSFNSQELCPSSSYYYGSINVPFKRSEVPYFKQIAIGNTGIEALSAYLGMELEESSAGAIENQLNTLLLGGSVQKDQVDIDQNIKEAQHERGFLGITGGVLWRIRRVKLTGESSDPELPEAAELSLPANIATQLNLLNLEQALYQKGIEEIQSKQTQIYAHWCKYMYSCYRPLGPEENFPDSDLIKTYVEWELSKLQALQSRVGLLTEPSGVGTSYTATGVQANNLLTALKDLTNSISTLNTSLTQQGYKYELLHAPAPRYYKPKDPAILFVSDKGAINMPASGTLAVQNVNMTVNTVTTGNNVPVSLADIKATVGSQADFQKTGGQWEPQLLQWLAEFLPLRSGSNVASPSGKYTETFVNDNFSLPLNGFDLEASNETTATSALEYSGTTFISSNTGNHMQEAIRLFLIKKYSQVVNAENFDEKHQTIFSAQGPYSAETQNYSNAGYTAYMAYKCLETKHILTQSLGGFNQALLQQQNSMHLPIKDPLGFNGYQAFTESIGVALNGITPPSSNPDNRFLPLRSGKLNLLELELIDRFGVGTKARLNGVYIAQSLKSKHDANIAWLPPRLPQQTRLNLRWLAAIPGDGVSVEMNSHPASSPICGWLLPNYFNNSLAVYNADGIGLGTFTTNGAKVSWSAFPASPQPINALNINSGINSFLLQLLQTIQINNNLLSFLDNMQGAQNYIYPEYYAGHDSLAILIGKPVAVVRARVSLEVAGGFVCDQGWIPFQQQLQGGDPITDDYEKIKFQVRLGENGQLNDGLIAFWENTQRGISGTGNWVNGAVALNLIHLSLSSGSKTLTMLMDPHGIVHATSGILPVKTVRIPTEQYSTALKNIEITFRTQPLLTPSSSFQVSLPKEQGYQWSWLEEKMNEQTNQLNWIEVPDTPLISETAFTKAWQAHLTDTDSLIPTSSTVWANLLSSNWIVPFVNNTNWLVVNKLNDTIAKTLLTNYTQAELNLIERILNSNLTGIKNYDSRVKFHAEQKLLEGWLKLTQVKTQIKN